MNRPWGAMNELGDAEVWRRIRNDDADAFGLLFARHAPRVHAFALRRTGDWAAAEDATAITFLEVWRRRHQVELENASALPWLLGVATHVVNHQFRSERRYRAALKRLADLPAPSPVAVGHASEAAEAAGIAVEHIRALPGRERDVLVLSVWEGLTHAEIAVALGIALGTVKSRLSRARARLGLASSSAPRVVHRAQRRSTELAIDELRP